jgi:hypothetical protein
MNGDNMNEYEIKYQQVVNGIISESEWQEYCFGILCDILDENKDVLFRLKNEWQPD